MGRRPSRDDIPVTQAKGHDRREIAWREEESRDEQRMSKDEQGERAEMGVGKKPSVYEESLYDYEPHYDKSHYQSLYPFYATIDPLYR
jgi:hypothetical protein